MFSYRIDNDIDLRLLQEKHSEKVFKVLVINSMLADGWQVDGDARASF